MYSISFTLSLVLSFFVSAPKTIQIISILSRFVEVTKHLPAPFVKPVFTPYTPDRFPNNSFVFIIVLFCPLMLILMVLVPTILEKVSFFRA